MSILGQIAADITENNVSAVGQIGQEAFSTFKKIVNTIFPIFIGVILVVALFYGVQLGIKYAKAEEEEDKKKAKGSLINVIVGCLIAIVFVAIIEIVLNMNFISVLFKNVAPDASTNL